MPLAILLGAAFTVIAAAAIGGLLLGPAVTDPALRWITGAALLSLAVFVVCAAGAAYAMVFCALGALAVGAGWRSLREADLKPRPVHRALLIAAVIYTVLYFFNAMAPEISYDGSRYHLGLVARYLREHGFHRITDNMYACLSQAVEMLYLFAFAFGKHSAAAMVHFAFLLALAWMMVRYAARVGLAFAGGCAAVLVFASPLVGADGTSAYIDVAVAAIAFALFYLLQLWDAQRGTRLLVAIGLIAGFAFAAKYTAWMAVPYALAFVAWKSRRLRDVLIVGICAGIVVAPWLLKNWLWVHNPVAPFYNGLFPNPYFTVAFEREYGRHMELYDLHSRWQIPLEVTTFGRLSGPLGPVFLLAPLALVSLTRREGRQLLLAAAVFGATYFSNISARFLIPSLPFIALAMALALSRFPRLLLSITVIHAVISWPSILRRYSAPEAWHLAKIPYREALRIKPEEGFLRSNLPLFGVARMVEQNAAPGSTVFTFTPIPEAYTSRHLQVAYESATGVMNSAVFYTGFLPDYAPSWQLRFSFARQTLRGVRIKQSAAGPDIWTIHELRFFDRGREIPREASWKWTAHPNPWGLEAIHDDNPVTRWICGDTLHPGQFVKVDFGAPLAVDEARIETSPNQWGIRLELEGIAASVDGHEVPPPPDLRRAAARELKRRGIDYILIFNHESGADDLRGNAVLWGVEAVAEYEDAALYRIY